jgi:subtilisin family serine protease
MRCQSRVFVRLSALAVAATLFALPAGAAPGPRDATITLVTGDRVRLTAMREGGWAIGVMPGPGRDHVGFVRTSKQRGSKEEITVMPSDAAALVAAGRLDPRLFNVTALLAQELDDQNTTVVPLILTDGAATPRSALPRAEALGGARAVRLLPSVNGTAVRQDKKSAGRFWAWVSGRAAATRVWLDARLRLSLDQSALQVGAPQAWAAGLTGTGVTVAVLDSGIRASHPDLAGKVVEALDFTGTQPEVDDDAGHGTHVAGIIAGTGAASDGRYRGIAHDARLLNGKVCFSDGFCFTSHVIAGMEWAAPRARIVNMSLGGGATDGTDPASQALNALSAEHGTLFVVAAGNSGFDQTVGAPASADAALAVGSVTKQDAISPFSSRGPRVGDFGLKPDMSAPGSAIVSARAAGTPVGDADPVGDHYARASGTSMATPHVAGAAALLAQAHPSWTGAQLKAALVSTTHTVPGATVYAQGSGRLDAARAALQSVYASGSLGFGQIRWPHTQPPITKTVTLHNHGDSPASLALALSVAGADGTPAPAGMFTASATQVTVPAFGTAEMSVTLDPSRGGAGLYGGLLTASAGATAVRMAVGTFKEPESYDLTLQVVSRGSDSAPRAQVVNVVTGEAFDAPGFDANGTAVLRLPKGTYDVNAFDDANAPPGTTPPFLLTLVSEPNVAVNADTTLVLDARLGRPVSAVADRPTAVRQFGELGVLSAAGGGGGVIAFFTRPFYQIFAVPTTRSATGHTYTFFFRATLAASTPGSDTSPEAFIYNLVFSERGRIPGQLTYRVRDRDLAVVRTSYHTQGAASAGIRGDFGRLSDGAGSGSFPFWNQALPSRRTEYYTARPDVTWFHLVVVFSAGPEPGSEVLLSERTYRPGPLQVGWNRAPVGPAFGLASRGWTVARNADHIDAAVPLFSGSQGHQFTDSRNAGLAGTTTLTRDGAVLGTSAFPGVGSFPVPASPGTYSLAAEGTRAAAWSVIGTRVEATWTFRDPGAAAPPRPLPLLVVRAALPVDLDGRARPGLQLVSLDVEHQPGARHIRVSDVDLDVSLDDGATWRAIPVLRLGDHAFALVRHPQAGGFVSLRAHARDVEENSVTHTMIRAYQVGPTP